MKKAKYKKKPSVVASAGIIILAAIAILAVIYPLANLTREPLTDEIRASLISEGKADQFIQTSLGTMHVRDSGTANGDIVFLIHGKLIGGHINQRWQKPLAEAGYRIIVPDLLGYGYSDRPNIPHNREFYVRQLKELLDGLGVNEPVNIIGASFGGAVVAAFTASHPERVSSVTLIAPPGLEQTAFVSGIFLSPIAGDWGFRVLGNTVARNMMLAGNADTSDARDLEILEAWMTEQTRFRGFGESQLNVLRNYAFDWQPEDFDTLGRLGLPVMAVWGTEDDVNPYSHTEELLRRVPQTRLVTLDGKGHGITFREASLTIAAVMSFLDEVTSAD